MYDTVWDKKCENVNITVPQRDCDTRNEMVMEMKCRVVNETVLTPVCVTIMENLVEEVSQNLNSVPLKSIFCLSNVESQTQKNVTNPCVEMYQDQHFPKVVVKCMMRSVK